MFNIGPLEIAVIAIVAILVFGPDRLPEFVRTAAKLLGQVRGMVSKAQNDLREELGPEFADLDVRDLNPRSFVRKHLLDGIDGDFDEKPVSNGYTTPERLPAGTRAPFDPEAT